MSVSGEDYIIDDAFCFWRCISFNLFLSTDQALSRHVSGTNALVSNSTRGFSRDGMERLGGSTQCVQDTRIVVVRRK